jgi:hypothetical protein
LPLSRRPNLLPPATFAVLRWMSPSRTTGRVRLAAVLGMAAAGLGLACYSPNIKNGGLTCAADGSCPSGFMCVASVCLRPDAGLDLLSPRDAPRETSSDRPEVGDGATEMVCMQTVAGCTPQSTSTCDPVCQTGCLCTQKCSVKHDETIACLSLQGEAKTWDTCQILMYDLPDQNDTCIAGDICLLPGGAGYSGEYCFQLCRNDQDCQALAPTGADAAAAGAAPPCVPRPVGSMDSSKHIPVANVCDVPYATCDPLADTGCPPNRPKCYLVSPDPSTNDDRFVCDYEPGTGYNGFPCSASRDCVDKWTCPTGARRGANVCHPVCNPSAANDPTAAPQCSVGQTCIPYGNTFGYCVPN